MKIVSWNVNSVRVRLDSLLDFLSLHQPDCLCLQEIKCLDEQFPFSQIESLGYNVVVLGQKSYNGVAILSKFPLEDVQKNLPNYDDSSSRYLEAVVSFSGLSVRLCCIYLPNGNPYPGEKFDYKMSWFSALTEHVNSLLPHEEILVLAGDYNVIPFPNDVYDAKAWYDDALFCPATRSAYQRLLGLGLCDAFALADGRSGQYSFWDYQSNNWPRDRGLRIDHMLLSPRAVDRLNYLHIHRTLRGLGKPSDHVPVELDLHIN